MRQFSQTEKMSFVFLLYNKLVKNVRINVFSLVLMFFIVGGKLLFEKYVFDKILEVVGNSIEKQLRKLSLKSILHKLIF